MKAYISPVEAERLTGIPATVIRQNIKRGIWTFGDRVPASKRGQKYDRYYIWVSKLEKHIGRRLNIEDVISTH